jgi:hypothetical protein
MALCIRVDMTRRDLLRLCVAVCTLEYITTQSTTGHTRVVKAAKSPLARSARFTFAVLTASEEILVLDSLFFFYWSSRCDVLAYLDQNRAIHVLG